MPGFLHLSTITEATDPLTAAQQQPGARQAAAPEGAPLLPGAAGGRLAGGEAPEEGSDPDEAPALRHASEPANSFAARPPLRHQSLPQGFWAAPPAARRAALGGGARLDTTAGSSGGGGGSGADAGHPSGYDLAWAAATGAGRAGSDEPGGGETRPRLGRAGSAGDAERGGGRGRNRDQSSRRQRSGIGIGPALVSLAHDTGEFLAHHLRLGSGSASSGSGGGGGHHSHPHAASRRARKRRPSELATFEGFAPPPGVAHAGEGAAGSSGGGSGSEESLEGLLSGNGGGALEDDEERGWFEMRSKGQLRSRQQLQTGGSGGGGGGGSALLLEQAGPLSDAEALAGGGPALARPPLRVGSGASFGALNGAGGAASPYQQQQQQHAAPGGGYGGYGGFGGYANGRGGLDVEMAVRDHPGAAGAACERSAGSDPSADRFGGGAASDGGHFEAVPLGTPPRRGGPGTHGGGIGRSWRTDPVKEARARARLPRFSSPSGAKAARKAGAFGLGGGASARSSLSGGGGDAAYAFGGAGAGAPGPGLSPPPFQPQQQRRPCLCRALWWLAAAAALLLVAAAAGVAVRAALERRRLGQPAAVGPLSPQLGPASSSGLGNPPEPLPPLESPPPFGCAGVSVENSIFPNKNETTGRITIEGTVYVTNRFPYVIAIQRCGVRLCSNIALVGHLRAEAACETYDVASREQVACTWKVALPEPPKPPGSHIEAWTGLLSSVELALSGERCASPVMDPVTGGAGSCKSVPAAQAPEG